MFKTCRCTGEIPLALSNMPGVEGAARCLARRRLARARHGCANHRARGGPRRGPRERGRARRRGRSSRSAGTSPDRTNTAGVEATDTRSAEHASRFNNAFMLACVVRSCESAVLMRMRTRARSTVLRRDAARRGYQRACELMVARGSSARCSACWHFDRRQHSVREPRLHGRMGQMGRA
jgi:hypothetical protein